jgi:glycosidase
MNGDGDHGKIRYDFPGGWKNDSINAFSPNYRTNQQNDVYNHIKTLNNIRKNSDAIGNGKLVHFIPEENVYVYFRQSGKETLMVILNGNKDAKEIKTSRFAQVLEGKKELKSLLSDLNYSEIPVQLKLEAFQSQIFKVY